MLNAILKPLLLKENITWEDFNYPPIFAWGILLVLGILTGLDPQIPLPLWQAILVGILLTAAGFGLIVVLIRWWMKRKGCDGQGKMFRLIMATAVIDIIAMALGLVGVSWLLLLPLQLYSLWVAAHALEQVCQVSLGYAISGVLITVVILLLTMIIIGAAISLTLAPPMMTSP